MSTPIVRFDRATGLDLKFRVARAGNVKFIFLNDSVPYSLNDTYQVNFKKQHDSVTNVLQLTEGNGLTIDDNELTIDITAEQSNIPERLYYWELYNATTEETWFSGYADFTSGTPDDSESATNVEINLGDTIINVSITTGGGGGGGISSVETDDVTLEGDGSDATPVKIKTGYLTKSVVGLGNVDNTSDLSKPVSTAQQTAINNAIAALVSSSPAALDTLNELATALGNDANFATTVTNALALKAALISPVFTGNPTAPTQSSGDNSTRLATTAYVDSQPRKIYESVNIEDPTASEDIWIFSIDEQVTITKVVISVSGTTPSVTCNIVFGANANTASPTKLWTSDQVITSETGQTISSFNNATVTAGYHLRVKTSAISGTVTGLKIQIFGTL